MKKSRQNIKLIWKCRGLGLLVRSYSLGRGGFIAVLTLVQSSGWAVSQKLSHQRAGKIVRTAKILIGPLWGVDDGDIFSSADRCQVCEQSLHAFKSIAQVN